MHTSANGRCLILINNRHATINCKINTVVFGSPIFCLVGNTGSTRVAKDNELDHWNLCLYLSMGQSSSLQWPEAGAVPHQSPHCVYIFVSLLKRLVHLKTQPHCSSECIFFFCEIRMIHLSLSIQWKSVYSKTTSSSHTGFQMTRGWKNYDRIVIFWWTVSLRCLMTSM